MNPKPLALPAMPGFAAGNWELQRVVETAQSPYSGTRDDTEFDGYAWRCALRCPPYNDDDAAVIDAWTMQASRADRYFYLSPPHADMRGNWGPAELVSNGTFIDGATTGWTLDSSAVLSVNARRLKIKNGAAAAGGAYQGITCEANKPHVLLLDGQVVNAASIYASIFTSGFGALEQQTVFTGDFRGVLMFVPSQASMILHLSNGSATPGTYSYSHNISVARCLIVNGGGQTGNALNVDGGPASVNAALKVGAFVTLRVKNRWQMVKLTEDFDTDANGAGTLRFEPALRDVPVDGEAVIVRNPFTKYRLSENIAEANLEAPNFKAFAVDAVEDTNEIDGEIQSDLIWAWDAENETLAPQIGMGTPTFTRAAATASKTNSAGVLVTGLAADTARFDYDPVTLAIKGLLLEEVRTNFALQSGTLSDAGGAWFGGGAFGNHNPATRTANAAIARDGTMTASRITGHASPTSGWAQRISVSPSTAYTFHIYAYKESGAWAVSLHAGNSGVYVSSVTSVDITATAGYEKHTITYAVPASGVNQIEVQLQNVTSSGAVIACDAQVEVGAFPTSSIPTTTGSVTRNADVPTGLLSAIVGFNNAALTMYAEAESAFDLAAHIVQLHSGGANRIIMERAVGGAVRGTTTGTTGGSATASGALAPGSVGKIALAVQANDMAISLNGGAVGADATLDVPTVATLRIGSDESGVAYWNGHIRKLRLYKRRLPNQMLKALSA